MLTFQGSKCSVGSGQEIGIPVIRLLLLDLRATDIGYSLLDVDILWVPLNPAVGYCVEPRTSEVLFVCFKEGRLGC